MNRRHSKRIPIRTRLLLALAMTVTAAFVAWTIDTDKAQPAKEAR